MEMYQFNVSLRGWYRFIPICVAHIIIEYDIFRIAWHVHGHAILNAFRAAVVRRFEDRLNRTGFNALVAFPALFIINGW